jgi:hypothetical protein
MIIVHVRASGQCKSPQKLPRRIHPARRADSVSDLSGEVWQSWGFGLSDPAVHRDLQIFGFALEPPFQQRAKDRERRQIDAGAGTENETENGTGPISTTSA